MKVWQRMTFCATAFLLALGSAGPATAASVSGGASTEIEWFDNGRGDTVVPVHQYLRLNVLDLAGKGYDFHGFGRLSEDLSGDTLFAESRLYYAYLEKFGLLENLDLRLGRQFITTTAGASLMDGVRLQYNNLGPLSVELFGGGDVSYYKGYNADDIVAGVEFSATFLEHLNLGLSFLQKWDDGDLSHRLIGFDASYDFVDLLQVYNETQYNYLADDVSYFLLGAKYYRNPKWSLRTEYLYSLPVFSATSIYSVFAVDEYEELLAELSYNVSPGVRAFGRYIREMYTDFDDANVFEAGIEKIRTARTSGYLVGTWRDDGDGQDLRGIKARVAYLFCPSFEGGVGAHVDVIERNFSEDDDETTASRIWVDGTLTLTQKVNVQGKIERVESDLWDEYWRGRVRLNVYF